MNIHNFSTLQMVRTNNAHFGQGKVQPLTFNMPCLSPIQSVQKADQATEAASVQQAESRKSFETFLMEAVNTVNSQQLDVTKVQEQLITNPDDVDIHDVTIAMAKARQSLNLAQTVIDRLVTGWHAITTTR